MERTPIRYIGVLGGARNLGSDEEGIDCAGIVAVDEEVEVEGVFDARRGCAEVICRGDVLQM